MNNNDEKIRNELYNNMIKNQKNENGKLKKIWAILESTLKSFKVLFIILIIFLVVASMYLFKDSTSVFIDMEEFVEADVGKITLVSQSTDDYQNGIFTFKLDKIPEIEIHAWKQYFKTNDDGRARVYQYLFDKWNNPQKSKFIVEEFYLDEEFKDETINNWILVYRTCINVTNYSELMEAIELVTEFAKYAEKKIDHYVNYSCSIQFNGEFINPYNESLNEISETVQEWYVGIVKEKNLDNSDIPENILEKY